MEQIALIRLARGQVGYYDELSRIHLTIGQPEAPVYAGTNCSQLRRSVKSGRLILVSGSLGVENAPQKIKKVSKTITAGNFIPSNKSQQETKAKTEVKKESTNKEERKTSSKTTVKKEAINKEEKTVAKKVDKNKEITTNNVENEKDVKK